MPKSDVFYALAILMGSILAGTLLAGALALLAPSQPPPPPALNASGNEQDHGTDETPAPSVDNGFAKNRAAALLRHDSKPRKGPQNEKTAPEEKHTRTNWWGSVADWRYWPVVNTLLLTVFNGILAFVAIRQWQNMRRQERLAHATLAQAQETVEQMRLDRRAWLTIDAEIISLDPGKPPNIDLLFLNSGKTPALINKIKLGCGWARDPSYDTIIIHHTKDIPWQPRENTVAPGTTYTTHMHSVQTLTEDEIQRIRGDRIDFYCIVTVAYSDFADGRETQSVLIYYPHQGRMQQCEAFNYMK
jgi:hypothetical protein